MADQDAEQLEGQEPGTPPGGGAQGDSNDVVQQFRDLPMGMLLCEPVMQVARGQSALCDVYLENIKKLAYKDYDPSKGDDNQVTNVISFTYDKPIMDKVTGQVSSHTFKVDAPLISLVAFAGFHDGGTDGGLYDGGAHYRQLEDRRQEVGGDKSFL
ncbi:MAG: hypothetical protein LBI85_03990 [Spirochaetaceae bacterium]|jgi:hypothetical protein|nr:hypothetical protein [Spirochaetaceae bacterium]